MNVSTYSAQYGLSQGTVTYNTASGTDQLHGDVFDIVRNSFFDSPGFFPTKFSADGTPTAPTDHESDYGFTIGGPVVIPKLYNGKKRTFFLFSLDNYHENAYESGFGTVPTAAMKGGDFSKFVDANGNQIPIYDPQTGLPFPGNKIPTSRFSPISQSLLQYIPDPNRTGTNFGLENNEKAAIPSTSNTINLFGFSLDHNLSEKQSLHFVEWHHSSTNPNFNNFPIVPENNPLEGVANNFVLGDSFLLNYVNSLTPNLVMTVGSSLYTDTEGSAGTSLDPTFKGEVSPKYFPSITFDGQNPISNWGLGTQGNTGDARRADGLAIDNNWLWSKGRHTFNIGGEYRLNIRDEND